MSPTIQASVAAAGEVVSNDELVNFGRRARDEINPNTGPRSYWFRFGDIDAMTVPQIQAAIGGLASAGMPGGADFMRVSALSADQFTVWPGSNFFELQEFSIDTPVQVRCSVRVA
jgi:hypothetical protein